MKIPAFITVRSASTRLPGKCFLSFGDGTVIEHIIKRCLHYDLRPIVCTTALSCDLEIVNIATANRVEYFQGQSTNKLMRWRDCANQFDLPYFHTVDADDPFFCGDEVKRSIRCMLDGRHDMVLPTLSSSNGGATVGYSLKTSIVKKACVGTNEHTDTEMMWSYIDRLKELNKAVLDEPASHRIEARLTLDYHEDYILLEAIRILLGSYASRAQVYQLLAENKILKAINESRGEEWAANQKKKSVIISG
jgi:spore coat polysaccharide biosynthesis protein SpsF (cytidylyltransferase family)